jgi:hypothetical protein
MCLIQKEKKMEALSFENVFGGSEIDDLFSDIEDTSTPPATSSEEVDEEVDNENEEETTEVNPDELFDEEEPESVGSKEKNTEEKGKGDPSSDDGDTSSPNFYSSFATAFAEDGVFPNLDSEMIEKVDSAESFSELIEAEVNARFEEGQRRILEALKNGVEPSDIKKFENTLNFLSSVTDASVTAESEAGEQLRRNLIYQDYLNKGYSQARAQKLTERTIEAGTDIEDAKEALQSNKEFFQEQYDNLLKEAEEEAMEQKKTQQKEAAALKDSLLKDKDILGDIDLTSDIRKKAYDNIAKPVYKDTESGEYLTPLQKYQMEHRSEFLKYVGLLFTVTNGFKDFSSFAKGKVKKEMRKSLRELEQTLNSTSRTKSGSLKLVTGVHEDPESVFKGIKLAL